MKSYFLEGESVQKSWREMEAAVLSKCLIIGATTTGVAKFRELLEDIGCRIIIIEEAAEVCITFLIWLLQFRY